MFAAHGIHQHNMKQPHLARAGHLLFLHAPPSFFPMRSLLFAKSEESMRMKIRKKK